METAPGYLEQQFAGACKVKRGAHPPGKAGFQEWPAFLVSFSA